MTTSKRDVEMQAAIAEAENEAEDRGPAVYVRPRSPKEPAQVYSVRLPAEYIERLRETAEQLGEKPTSLMRTWIIERLSTVAQPQRTMRVEIVHISRREAVLGDLDQSLREIDAAIAAARLDLY